MKKPIALIICLVFILSANILVGQDDLNVARDKSIKKDTRVLPILSLDGKDENVKVTPDYVHSILRINCSKSTINIPDFWGMPPEVTLLGKKFIVIKYAVRGGSNLILKKAMIICFNNGRLYEAIHVSNQIKWESKDLKMDYSIKLALKENKKDKYQLAVNIHDNVYSKTDPGKNYVHDDQTILSFDIKKNAFYSIKKNMGNLIMKTKIKTAVKQQISGNFPVVILGKETYYFINNNWYQIGSKNQMDEV